MIKIAVVEDESAYREQLACYLERYQKDHLQEFQISYYTDGDVIAHSYPGGYDVILMDIKMRFMDGMTAAEAIRARDEKVIIIFITNMQNYAVKGYQVNAFDYILKPITYFGFEKSLRRALERVSQSQVQAAVTISTGEGLYRVGLKEIYYVESDGHYLLFYTAKGVLRTYMRIRDIEKELEGYHFYRINKGIIVNLRYVDGVEKTDCLIRTERLPISRAKLKEFMTVLTRYFSSY